MKPCLRAGALTASSFLAVLALLAAPALAAPVAGLRTDGAIAIFDSDVPEMISESHAITGLAAGFTADDVDVRPSNGQLYLLATGPSSSIALYTVDPGTGAASPVGAGTIAGVTATAPLGIDFDGSSGHLHVVTAADHDIEVDPDTGLKLSDTPISASDVASVAYRNGLFGWDSVRRRVVRIAGATVTDVSTAATGPSGASAAGFDAGADGTALLGSGTALWRADLTTGMLTAAGTLPQAIKGLAFLRPSPFALPNDSLAVAEDAAHLNVVVSRPTAAGTMTVDYATAADTAGVDDFTSVSGSLTFPPGVELRSFEVPIEQDAVVEPPQTFKVALSRPSGGGSLGPVSAATVTIFDDDAPPGRADRIAPRVLLAPDVRRRSLRTLRRRGIPGSLSCSEACRAEVALKLPPSTILGAGGRVMRDAGPARFKVRLTPGGRRLLQRRLKRRKMVRLALALTAYDPSGNVRVVRTRFIVTR